MSWRTFLIIAFLLLITLFTLFAWADFLYTNDVTRIGTAASADNPSAGQSGQIRYEKTQN